MKILLCSMPPMVGGSYVSGGPEEAIILLNTHSSHPQKRRYMIATLAHELTHHIQTLLRGEIRNPYDSYCQELWCYRVQWVVERLLFMKKAVDIENGALMSIISFIHLMLHPPANAVKWWRGNKESFK